MATAAERNARRRLQTLLDSEEYGPALARLRGADERRVLTLIEQNRGAEARREILAADERRRTRVRVQRRATLVERAVQHTVAAHQAHYDSDPADVRRNLRHATDAELRFVLGADHYQLADQARAQPHEYDGELVNPFWYH